MSKANDFLQEFYCTEHYHQWSVLFPFAVATDGVKELAVRFECYWLLDAIASHQPRVKSKHPEFFVFQVWKLKKDFDDSWKLWLGDGKDNRLLMQSGGYTDFAHGECEIWVQPTVIGDKNKVVLLLPSEY